jgi:Predicted membrane protein
MLPLSFVNVVGIFRTYSIWWFAYCECIWLSCFSGGDPWESQGGTGGGWGQGGGQGYNSGGGNWSSDNFGGGYQQSYGGGPMRGSFGGGGGGGRPSPYSGLLFSAVH